MKKKQNTMLYGFLTTKIELTPQQQKAIYNQAMMQFKIWNTLVEFYNPIIQEDLNARKKDALYKETELEHFIKECYPELKENKIYPHRLYRTIAHRYLKAWKKVFEKRARKFKPPQFHSWDWMRYSVEIKDIDRKIQNHTATNKFVMCFQKKGITKDFKECLLKDEKIIPMIIEQEGTITEYTIIQRNGSFFLHLGYKYKIKKLIQSGNGEIGLDWGLKNFFTDNYGCLYNIPIRVFRVEQRIRKLQSVFSFKSKDSYNRIKTRQKINAAYYKMTRIKWDWIEKTTTKLLRENRLICYETIKIEELRKNAHKSKRRWMDLHPYAAFVKRLEEKSKKYTCVLQPVGERFPSTQICSCCGNIEYKPIKQRQVLCSFCENKTMDRDVNAAINILREGRRLANLVQI